MSDNEVLKAGSRHLRGTLAEALEQPSAHFEEGDLQLLKFHGSYQQDDRDQRRERKAAGAEKAYQFMVRSRIPGGAITSEQYLMFDDLAQSYGNGAFRLTTRQSIQLHGVLKGNLRSTIRTINDNLLSTLAACGDVNRNVMACPAPSATKAHAQVQECARRIALHLAPRTGAYHEIWLDGEKLDLNEAPEEEPLYGRTYLPRKFKIAVTLEGDNCIDVYTNDIGFVAHVEQDSVVAFTVLAGGGMGSTHGKSETYPRLATPLCAIEPAELLEIAETIVAIQRDYGDRTNRKHARMKYVVEERGIDWFREQLETRLGRKVAPPRPVRFDDAEDHLGWHRGPDGTWYLGVLVENGRVRDTVHVLLRSGLRDAVRRFQPTLRITAQQNLLVSGIATEDRSALEELLRGYGIVVDAQMHGIGRRAMACPALPTCGLAVAEAERHLPSLLAEIDGYVRELEIDAPLPSVRMTGCPNGCARPRMGDIGIVGRSLGIYDIYLGGDAANTRLNQPFAQSVRQAEIPGLLRSVFDVWERDGNAGEGLGDFAFRYGIEALTGAAELVRTPSRSA